LARVAWTANYFPLTYYYCTKGKNVGAILSIRIVVIVTGWRRRATTCYPPLTRGVCSVGESECEDHNMKYLLQISPHSMLMRSLDSLLILVHDKGMYMRGC